MTTTLTLATLPPSANVIWRTGRSGTYRNPKYVAWLNSEGLLLKSQLRGQTKFNEPVYVTMPMRRPRINSDADNRIKPVGDLLQTIGAVSNDKLIDGWKVFWSTTLPKGIAAQIRIEPVDSGAWAMVA